MRQRRNYSGFSLIEVFIALAVIALILGIALPTYSEHRKRVLIAQAQKDIVLIGQRLETYFALNYEYPEYLADMGIVEMEDPWGNEYQYLNKADVDPVTGSIATGTQGAKPVARTALGNGAINSDFDLFSMGEDGDYDSNIGSDESADDVIRADNGDFVDLAEKY